MQIEDTLTAATKALRSLQVRFALIGGFALAAHGVVRATQDIHLLVDGHNKEAVKNALLQAGFKLSFQGDEVLHFSGPGQLDILFANRAATQDMLSRATLRFQFPVPVVAAEDLIGLKIQAYKNDPKREFRDKADIQAPMEKNEDLDFELVKKYADIFDEWPLIETLRKTL